MPATKKRAVIFDFDGVVADSFQLHEKCWRYVLKQHGLQLPDGALAKSIGLSSADTAELIAKELDGEIDPAQLGGEKSRRFGELAGSELKPMAGAPAALERVHGEFVIAVAAIRRRVGVDRFLKKFDLEKCIDQVVTMDDLQDERDVGELLAVTAKRLELPAGRCVVVQDARHGVLAAKRLKMKTLAFDSNPKHDLDFSGADAEVTTLDELVPELINSVAAA